MYTPFLYNPCCGAGAGAGVGLEAGVGAGDGALVEFWDVEGAGLVFCEEAKGWGLFWEADGAVLAGAEVFELLADEPKVFKELGTAARLIGDVDPFEDIIIPGDWLFGPNLLRIST